MSAERISRRCGKPLSGGFADPNAAAARHRQRNAGGESHHRKPRGLDSAAKRLQLSPEEKEEVHFLIEHHLDMSATVQRRDIFDPATVSAFAQSVTTLERLQRLCLLTYADIHSVNPEALTPWKAEMLWQLFVATSNTSAGRWIVTLARSR